MSPSGTDLREELALLASNLPNSEPDIVAMLRAGGRRRQLRVSALSALVMALSGVAVATVLSGSPSSDEVVLPDVPVSAVPTSNPPPATPDRTGPVFANSSAASCVVGSPAEVANRAFAFDGTVTMIGPGTSNKPGKGRIDTNAVTFAVNEWFRGGSQASVTVDMMRGGEVSIGTRLLVSGEPRWGGAPLEDAIAWSCGGFTSYFEESIADAWRSATG